MICEQYSLETWTHVYTGGAGIAIYFLIPSHSKEKADKLAMECAHTEQPDANVSYQEKATIIKALRRPNQGRMPTGFLVGQSK